MRRSIGLVLVVVAASLSACSSDDHSTNGMNMPDDMHHGSNGADANQPVAPGAREIPVRAGALSFQPKQLRIAANQDVTIVLTSTDIEHDLMVQGIGHVVHARAGKTAKGGLKIDTPGTYRFWCTVRGHKAGGMVGTITVV